MCVYIFTSPLNMTVLETVGSIAKYYEEKKPHSGILGLLLLLPDAVLEQSSNFKSLIDTGPG